MPAHRGGRHRARAGRDPARHHQLGPDRSVLVMVLDGTPGTPRPSVSIWAVDEATPGRTIVLAGLRAQDHLLGDFAVVVDGRPRVVRVVVRAMG